MRLFFILFSTFLIYSATAEDRPNILFIMIDDLGWYDLACQGNSKLVTPHIDQLAKQGVRFTDAYAAAPVCSPTRAAAITGLYPARLQITQHGGDRWNLYKNTDWGPGKSTALLDPSHVTIAERLKGVGYETSFIGKWHLSGYTFEGSQKYLPDNQGFDVNIAGNGWGGPGGVGSFFAPYKLPNLKSGPKGEYLPDRLADEAITRLKHHAGNDKPFFMCLMHYTIHWPIEAPDALYKKYSDKPKPGNQARYQAMVEGMDAAVGKTLAALDKLGLTENTLVVLTSDNGDLAGYMPADPLREFKGFLYEGGIRVPSMIRWPKRVKAGVVSDTPISTVDYAPTFAEAAGIEIRDGDFDGASLLGEVTGVKKLDRDAIYFHYPHHAWHSANNMGSVIRQGRYKLIHNFTKKSYELYDLKSDLSESKNLIGDLPEKAEKMKKKLMAWKKSVDAQDPRRKASIPEGELAGKKE